MNGELPACGTCGEDLVTRTHAIEHMADEHGLAGPAVVSAVLKWNWPDEDEEVEA